MGCGACGHASAGAFSARAMVANGGGLGIPSQFVFKTTPSDPTLLSLGKCTTLLKSVKVHGINLTPDLDVAVWIDNPTADYLIRHEIAKACL